MHEKYAKDGLVVISVALDDIHEEPESKDRALKFLKDKKATFTNLLLDEPIDFWQKKFEFVGPPTVYIFNRQGKWIRFKADEADIDHEKIEKLVVEMLRAK
jgi:hypothetical protein